MMFDSKRMQIMTSGLDALATQQKTILHNLSNLETPGYKAKRVVFEDILRDKQGRYQVRHRVETSEDTARRPDGNNVDTDAESLRLFENYTQQQYLFQKISGQFNNYRYVLKSGPK